MKQTLKEWAVNHDGYIDMDITDKDIDMAVAFVWYADEEESEEPYDKFLNLVASNVEIEEEYSNGMLCCNFSKWLQPYNNQLVAACERYGWSSIEFDGDETFYDFILWMENLIPGNCSDSVYNKLLEVLSPENN